MRTVFVLMMFSGISVIVQCLVAVACICMYLSRG